MAAEIGGGIVQIWLKVTAKSDGGEWIYQMHWTRWEVVLCGSLCCDSGRVIVCQCNFVKADFIVLQVMCFCGWEVGAVRGDESINISLPFHCLL